MCILSYSIGVWNNYTRRILFGICYTNFCVLSDSSDNVCIEDCSIGMGYDAIALKSGWDEYGIAYGRPTTNVHIRRVYLQSSSGSSLAFGSEMSGGISDVFVEQVHIYNSFSGIQFRTTKGRGGYIREIIISDVEMENIHMAFGASGQFGSHPDDKFDPNALPDLDHITLQDVIGTNITIAGSFTGIQESPFTSFCLSNISLSANSGSPTWECSNVSGSSDSVFPQPCSEFNSSYSSSCFSLLTANGKTAVLWYHSSYVLQLYFSARVNNNEGKSHKNFLPLPFKVRPHSFQ